MLTTPKHGFSVLCVDIKMLCINMCWRVSLQYVLADLQHEQWVAVTDTAVYVAWLLSEAKNVSILHHGVRPMVVCTDEVQQQKKKWGKPCLKNSCITWIMSLSAKVFVPAKSWVFVFHVINCTTRFCNIFENILCVNNLILNLMSCLWYFYGSTGQQSIWIILTGYGFLLRTLDLLTGLIAFLSLDWMRWLLQFVNAVDIIVTHRNSFTLPNL